MLYHRGIQAHGQYGIFTFKGEIGYQNSVEELHRICTIYGRGTHAIGARSVTIEDINKITGYNPNAVGIRNPTSEQIANGDKYNKGTIQEYGNKITYYWGGDEYPEYTYLGLAETGKLISKHDSDFGFHWYNGKSWQKFDYTTTPGKICETVSNAYYYYPETLTTENNPEATVGIKHDSVEYELLFNVPDESNFLMRYYLASKCVNCDTYSVGYSIMEAGSGNVTYGASLAASCNTNQGIEILGIRAIVTLEPDIKLEKNETMNVWEFR